MDVLVTLLFWIALVALGAIGIFVVSVIGWFLIARPIVRRANRINAEVRRGRPESN